MIHNETELRHSLETIAKLYSQSEREARETAWDEEARREMSEDTNRVRENIEREVAEYLAQQHGLRPASRPLSRVA